MKLTMQEIDYYTEEIKDYLDGDKSFKGDIYGDLCEFGNDFLKNNWEIDCTLSAKEWTEINVIDTKTKEKRSCFVVGIPEEDDDVILAAIERVNKIQKKHFSFTLLQFVK